MSANVKCKNCDTDNPFYQLNCIKCKAYLRERVYNIDLWQTLENLIASPAKAFTKIIYSEQKNYLLLILALSSLKFLINTIFFFLINPQNTLSSSHFLRNYSLILASIILILWMFSASLKIILKFLNISTRIKDTFAAAAYSLVPHAFGILFLFPLELIFFGEYLFSNNPSPFLIKNTTAYIMAGLEIALIIWSLFLSFGAIFTFTRNLFYSVISGLFFNIGIFSYQFIISFYIFN